MEARIPSGRRCDGEFARGKEVVVFFFAIRKGICRLGGRWVGVELGHYVSELKKGFFG